MGAAQQVRPHARALRLGDVRWVHVDALAHVAPLVGEDGLLRVWVGVRVRVRVGLGEGKGEGEREGEG